MAEPNYVKEAFKRQENLIGIGGFLAAGLIFNPGFLFLGAAAEIAYLWMISSNERFRRVVRSARGKEVDALERKQLIDWLSEKDRASYRDLEATCRQVYDAWQKRDPVTKSILQPSVEKLDYLLHTFLKSQRSLDQMQDYLDRSNRSMIEKELALLEAQMTAPKTSDKLREANRRNAEILKNRLARLEKLREDVAVTRAHIKTLDNAIRFVADQSMTTTDPHQLSSQIDSIVQEAQLTEKSVAETEVFIQAAGELESQRAQAASKERAAQ